MGSVTSTRAAVAGHVLSASTVDVDAFRTAMGSFPTGITVVTVACDDEVRVVEVNRPNVAV